MKNEGTGISVWTPEGSPTVAERVNARFWIPNILPSPGEGRQSRTENPAERRLIPATMPPVTSRSLARTCARSNSAAPPGAWTQIIYASPRVSPSATIGDPSGVHRQFSARTRQANTGASKKQIPQLQAIPARVRAQTFAPKRSCCSIAPIRKPPGYKCPVPGKETTLVPARSLYLPRRTY
jgi:hypothetical protein